MTVPGVVKLAVGDDLARAMTGSTMLIAAVAVLLDAIASLLAPVVPVTVLVPVAVGVPETVHVIAAPAATVVGGAGAHDDDNPVGNPVMAQVACVALTGDDATFVQEYVPL
jgi:hypothetical protein